MTKQEEIRGGIYLIRFAGRYGKSYKLSYPDVDEVLSYLHKQGVMIKVKCPDCEWSQFGDESVGMTPCYSCNSIGFIIEPLIGEDEQQ